MLALAAGARAFGPGDCLNSLQFSGASMAADFKVTFSGAGKPIKAGVKSKKGGGAQLGGAVPLAFKPSGKPCTMSTASLDDASVFGLLSSVELGSATVAPYLATVATVTGSDSKKGNTLTYEIKGLQLQLGASGGVGLKKPNGKSKFNTNAKIVAGNMTVTLAYTPKDGAAGTATANIDLSKEASISKVGGCSLSASSKSGAFEMDCKNLQIQLSPISKSGMSIELSLKGSNVKAAGQLSATASIAEPPKLDPKTVADTAAFAPEVLDAQGALKENAKCTSSFLQNDAVPDFENTRVYVECDSTWYEVNSIYLTAQKLEGAPGCDVKGAGAADKGASLGFDNSYSGDEDPFYVPSLYQQWSKLVYYPPTNYPAAYTATFRYKLARAGSADSIATVTCDVGAPTPVGSR